MPDPETALAMTAATTIVAAMATSAWQATKAGVARIFRQVGGAESGMESGADTEIRLERSAAQVANAADPDEVRQAQIVQWREDLVYLMREHPEAAEELRPFVEAIQRQLPPVQERWVQNIKASDGGFAAGAQGPGSSVVVHRDRETPPTPPTGDGR